MEDPHELEQLQAVMRRMTVQSQYEHDRVTRLRLELQQLSNTVRSNDAIYQKHIRYYAMKDCLRLVKMMHQRLPAELRDLVYEFLCVEPDRKIPVGPYYHFRHYDKPFHDPIQRLDFDDEPRIIPNLWPSPSAYRPVTRNNPDGDVDMEEAETSNDVQMSPDLTERVMKGRFHRQADRMSWLDDSNITVLSDGRVKEEHTNKPPRDMPLPYYHFLDPRYVGPEVAYEIQKIYYTRNTFSICSVEQAIYYFLRNSSGYNIAGYSSDGTPNDVPKELETEPRLYPRNNIRHLQVRVKLEQFQSDMPSDHFSDLEKYAYERRFLRFTRQNLDGLRGFLRDRSKQEIDVEFVIMTELPDFEDDQFGWGGQCNYVNFLESVRKWVYILKYDCDNITVTITHYDPGMTAMPRDITGLFGLTKEQWDQEKAVHQDRGDDWAEQFHLGIPGYEPDGIPLAYPAGEVDRMIRERWGMETVVDTKATLPVREGRYWPRSIVPMPLD